MKLTDTAIKAAKPSRKPYKLFDGGGQACPNVCRLKFDNSLSVVEKRAV